MNMDISVIYKTIDGRATFHMDEVFNTHDFTLTKKILHTIWFDNNRDIEDITGDILKIKDWADGKIAKLYSNQKELDKHCTEFEQKVAVCESNIEQLVNMRSQEKKSSGQYKALTGQLKQLRTERSELKKSLQETLKDFKTAVKQEVYFCKVSQYIAETIETDYCWRY